MGINNRDVTLLYQIHHYVEDYVDMISDCVGHGAAEASLEEFEILITKLGKDEE